MGREYWPVTLWSKSRLRARVAHGHTHGVLALVGGAEWTEGCTFDTSLLAASGGTEVVVLPTAAAYQHPERVVLGAAEWFGSLGAQVEGLMVVDRAEAEDPAWRPSSAPRVSSTWPAGRRCTSVRS